MVCSVEQAMESITQKDIDWLLQQKNGGDFASLEPPRPKKKKRWALRIITGLLSVGGLIILPFFLLIRTAVYLNLTYQWNGWLSLGGGILATVLILVIYVFIVFRKVNNKRRLLKLSLLSCAIMVSGFCAYGVIYLSSVNAKSDEVRQVYRSMHPILRVAISTTTLADGDLVVTDIQRVPEDYNQMGLAVNQNSLHYTQASGYVHAIDLRTRGRHEFRNFVLRHSLNMMGFSTLRHVGTADHLHISIPVAD
ncbi:hypothetical protein [Gracilimonas mengyeensis]|uniref:Uncharacterized protein n=1 Tax=Gracilimonas mengyeensis TaxID=1302730 RepID=A0A521ENF1_9BACT|nr:hypothetical protein [Gracilimonas mengyeensis]SMO84981.1 hypothetical protein SAMN06265219_112150 [Gracilimonas mengyeensis]